MNPTLPPCPPVPPPSPSLSSNPYDAVIVGAGPAGALAAILLARKKWNVLLLDRAPWPRDKPCGGCLNASALGLLDQLELTHLLPGAQSLTHFNLRIDSSRKSLRVKIPPGLAVERKSLDAALVREAIRQGATFLPQTSAKLLLLHAPGLQSLGLRAVYLTSADQTQTVAARLILAADGLAGTFLADEPWANWTVTPHSWIGLSAHFRSDAAGLIPPHTVHMLAGPHAYIGLVRLSQDTAHLGAAIDPAAAKTRSPTSLLQSILEHHAPFRDLVPYLERLKIQGTPLLTRRRKILGHHRILVLGDAAAYVEPFTGQGIGHALLSAQQLVSLLPENPAEFPESLPARWTRLHRETFARKNLSAQLFRHLARHPALAHAAFTFARTLPIVSSYMARSIAAGKGASPTLQGAHG